MPLTIDDVDIAAARAAAPEILSSLVQCRSDVDERETVAYLTDRLRAAGRQPRTTDVEQHRQNLITTIGSGPHSLILHGHMDTVPPDDEAAWSHPPFSGQVVNGELWGRGSSDAKGSLAGMVAAFEAICRAGGELPGQLQLWCVAMEERAGMGTLVEVQAGTRAEAAIVGEPTNNQVHIAHKGALRMVVTTTGVAAHSSAPWDGRNAITSMAPVILELDKLAQEIAQREEAPVGRASLAVTLASGGVARNVIPPVCTLTVDRRLLPGEDAAAALQEVVSRLEGLPSQPRVEQITLADAAGTKADHPLVHYALAAHQQTTGSEAAPGGFTACCDMRLLTNEGGMPAVILGPGDLSMAHKIDERIRVQELEDAAELYVRLALNWLSRTT